MKFFIAFLVFIFILIKFSPLALASNRLLYENFDDGMVDRFSFFGNIILTDSMNYPDNESGFSLKVDYTVYIGVPANVISLFSEEYSDEFYFSYLYKYDENCDMRYGWKPFRMQTPLTDSGSYALFFNDNVESEINNVSFNFTPGINSTGEYAVSYWKTTPPQTRNVWHKFELYYKQNTPNVADGILNFKIDEVDVINENSFQFLNDGETFTTFMLPSNANSVSPPGIIYIDDIEIWDGMPNESLEVPTETCTDNIQNQDETGIDCGGVCDACEIPITYTLTNFISAITNWLQIGNETSDVNSDGVVNTRDLGVVMSNWSN